MIHDCSKCYQNAKCENAWLQDKLYKLLSKSWHTSGIDFQSMPNCHCILTTDFSETESTVCETCGNWQNTLFAIDKDHAIYICKRGYAVTESDHYHCWVAKEPVKPKDLPFQAIFNIGDRVWCIYNDNIYAGIFDGWHTDYGKEMVALVSIKGLSSEQPNWVRRCAINKDNVFFTIEFAKAKKAMLKHTILNPHPLTGGIERSSMMEKEYKPEKVIKKMQLQIY